LLYAVTIEPLNAIFFLAERPDADPWEVQEGVEIDIPTNYVSRSVGGEPVEQILCMSVSDPKHYKIFKNKKDIDPSKFQPTGKHFGGMYSKLAWARLMKNLPSSLAFQVFPETEPPGATDEALELISRKV
jgi:hypothetical protein